MLLQFQKSQVVAALSTCVLHTFNTYSHTCTHTHTLLLSHTHRIALLHNSGLRLVSLGLLQKIAFIKSSSAAGSLISVSELCTVTQNVPTQHVSPWGINKVYSFQFWKIPSRASHPGVAQLGKDRTCHQEKTRTMCNIPLFDVNLFKVKFVLV